MLEARRRGVSIDGRSYPGSCGEDQAYRAMDLLVEAYSEAKVQEAVSFARSLSSRLRRLVVKFSERSPVWLACLSIPGSHEAGERVDRGSEFR